MKITKEHLHYIYADNNKSNRDKLSTLCDNFGVKCLNDEGFKFIEIYSCHGGFSDDFELLGTDNPESTSRFVSSDDIDEMLRVAALEVSKPVSYDHVVFSDNSIPKLKRTKVEYEKVGFHKCHEAMFEHEMEGGLYVGCNSRFELATPVDIAENWSCNNLYRRIETPMTWKEELYNYLDNSCEMSDDFDDSFTIEIEGRPLEFNLNDDEFVDMCKLVASLNSVN
jgi:hypothetical protein